MVDLEGTDLNLVLRWPHGTTQQVAASGLGPQRESSTKNAGFWVAGGDLKVKDQGRDAIAKGVEAELRDDDGRF